MPSTTASPSARPIRVVVLGAGPGGVQTYNNLAARLTAAKLRAELVLVNDRDYFYSPISAPRALADATDATPAEALMFPLRALVDDAPAAQAAYITRRVLVARVQAVTSTRVSVVPARPGAVFLPLLWHPAAPSAESGFVDAWTGTDLGADLSFDYLVVALGSKYPFPGRPLPAATADETAAAYAAVRGKLAAAKDVLVIGAGIVGVEFAGEVKTEFPKANVTLVGPSLLAGSPAAFTTQVRKILANKGVTLIEHASADADALLAATGDAQFPLTRPQLSVPLVAAKGASAPPSVSSVTADLVLLATGVKPNSEPLAALPTTDRGYLKVTPTLQVEGHAHIFAAGDIAEGSAKLAYIAGEHAKLVAKNLARVAAAKAAGKNGKKPLREWKTPPPVAIAAVGRDAGAGFLPGVGTAFGIGASLAKKLKGKDGGVALPAAYAGTSLHQRVQAVASKA
ncbi:hypothetical protein H9P43_001897 [Blastocladiella emersonii ATCC 22665]|nr:hypothetical protein H9P43_001897 [Blastocladiella emersonii ATCC 22665]